MTTVELFELLHELNCERQSVAELTDRVDELRYELERARLQLAQTALLLTAAVRR